MKKKVWFGLLLLVLIPVVAYLVLFELNIFSFVIEPKGQPEITLSLGETYEEPGVEMKLVGSLFFRDGIAVDRELMVIGSVDPQVPGDYLLEYRADFENLKGYGTRLVHVVDTVPPEIMLNSIPGSYTLPGGDYVEEGFSAWDNIDGDLTERVTREEKDGMVYYSVADLSGNRTTVGRMIRYLDPVCPEIHLLGDHTVYLTCGEEYTEPGWTAIDNVDGDLSDRVTVSGQVDKYRAGTYQLSYTVVDESGNSGENLRTVVMCPVDRPETVKPSDKVIYLTFDDGPCYYTPQILEILDKYDVKATFFVIKTDAMNVLSDIVEAGHSVGIHSVSHIYREIYASPDAFFSDLLTMQQIIYEETGVKTWLMRFPGGSSNTVSRFNEGIMSYLTQAVQDMGFCYFDWNVDSRDAGGAKDAKAVYENVINGVQQQRISIVLQHDIKDISVLALEKILIWGLENGYRFLPLDMTSPTAHHGVNN